MEIDKANRCLQDLPVAEVAHQVIRSLKSKNVLLQAEPGAGKSTGLPLALLSEYDANQKIILLEPRRLAAISVAERLASQLGEKLGSTVGLRMRGRTSISVSTRIEVVTEGVLTKMLQNDPTLAGVGLVVFDEFHERSLHADLGLALCLEIQRSLREDLRILLMSATLDDSLLQQRLDDVELITCKGRQHPVNIEWLGEQKGPVSSRVASVVNNVLSETTGDLLAFLPGVAEIEQTAILLEREHHSNCAIFKLHGGSDAKTTAAATRPANPETRRIILSTSITETSITIDGVRVVIDSGLERRGRVENTTGAIKLETVPSSQASAKQRSGRAGRTAPGQCFRLWSEHGHHRREKTWLAEIFRSDLSPLLMELGQWGVRDVNELPWIDSPPAAAIARAEELLTSFNFWNKGRLTERGRQAARLSVHPRLANMLLWAIERRLVEPACKLSMILEEGSRQRYSTDLEQTFSQPLPQRLKARYKQLVQQSNSLLTRITDTDTGDTHKSDKSPSLAIFISQAYPDWIGQRRSTAKQATSTGNNFTRVDSAQETNYRLSCGAGAIINEQDTLAQSQWLAIAQLGGASQQMRIFSACHLNIDELTLWAPEMINVGRKLDWDNRAERVVAEEQYMLGKLIITAKPLESVSDHERALALLSGIQQNGLQCLPWTDDSREFLYRIQLMSSLHQTAGTAEWPLVNEEYLLDNLETWLLPYLTGVNSFKGLTKLDLVSVLNGQLNYKQQKELDQKLPKRYTVPSGSSIKLRYSADKKPVLSVKLQEMFGCFENPSIANGEVSLTVELLSPARRPIQVTEDLANFWSSSYHEVRKDMAGRYPKHDWPINPESAVPTAKAKPRVKKR